MKLATQKYRQAKVSELTPHPQNPRQGDVGAIHTSIETNGFYGALIVQKSTGFVLAGNHRLQAAVATGATSVPIIEVDVDDDTALKILLVDNRTNDLATYDDPALAELLRVLAEMDKLLGTGYEPDDVDAMLKEWASDMPGVESSTPATSQGKLIVTFDEANRDAVRELLVAAIAASPLAGRVEVS